MAKQAIEQAEHKRRHRSPNYPAVGLRDAVERLRNLYAKDGKAGAPAHLAAVHIGFSKPHGQAMSVLAALKRFGLLAESGGRFAPTQRGLEILNLPAGDQRRQKALQEAAVEPSIYRELIEQHRESGWPADDVLASELVTYRSFNPKAVERFVTDLRDTLEFSGLSDPSALEATAEVETVQEPEKSVTHRFVKKATQTLFYGGVDPATLQTRNYAFDISIPRHVKGELKIVGPFGKEDLERLKKALNGQLAMIEAALED